MSTHTEQHRRHLRPRTVPPAAGLQHSPHLPQAGSALRNSGKSISLPLPPGALPAPTEIVNLLNRISFGPTAESLERAQQLGYEDYIEEQLDPESIDDSVLDSKLKSRFPSLTRDISKLINKSSYRPAEELKKAAILRAIESRRQLYEVMVDFWSDHFSIYHYDDYSPWLKHPDDRGVVRPHALGKFGDLLMASAKSPAMLVYLDNHVNTKYGPNENYARELLELHTLGVNGGYTQEDVEEVARCFTGWGMDWRAQQIGRFDFDLDLHDQKKKTVLGRKIKRGGGIADGEKVVGILAEHDSTADFIAYKLCRRFAADVPPKSLVRKAARTFRQTKGDIRAVLRTILLSKKFRASADRKLRRPMDFVAAAIRALGGTVSKKGNLHLLWWLYGLGHSPFDWIPPNGYPDVGDDWASTHGLLNRWNFGIALAAGWIGGVTTDIEGIVEDAGVERAGEIVDLFVERLLHRDVRTADRDLLIDFVSDGKGEKRKLSGYQLDANLPGLAALLLNSPYFQLR